MGAHERGATLERRRWLPSTLRWGVIACVLIACGDDSSTAPPGDAATDPPPAPPTPTPPDADTGPPAVTGTCDAAELASALAGAALGSVVRVGACRIEGAFTVPAGVTLEGSGEASVLVGGADDIVVTLSPGARAARLARLNVESHGPAGVFASGEGEVEVADVAVDARAGRGIAVGAEGLSALRIERLSLVGPVTPDNAATFPVRPDRTMHATHGLALARVASASLTDVSASGFSANGVLLVQSDTTWRGGSARENLFLGLLISGGRATLESIDVGATLTGPLRGGTYGVVIAQGAVVDTTDLEICEGEGYGILQDGGAVTHVDLSVCDNADVGVWAQRGASLAISGSGTRLSNNLYAGILALDASRVVVTDATVSTTRLAPHLTSLFRSAMMGDGLQLARSSTSAAPLSLELRDLTLDRNGRTGLVIDANGATFDDVALSQIVVDGEGEQLGAIAQSVSGLPVGWDTAIERRGATATNDASFAGVLEVVGIVDPPMLPAELASGSLDGLLGR